MGSRDNAHYKSNLDGVLAQMRDATERAMNITGEFIKGQAVLNITASQAVDTGQLRSSIEYKALPDEHLLVVGTNVEYAVYVEMGTGIYAEGGRGRQTRWAYDYQGRKGRKGLRWTRGMKPRKFLSQAFLQNQDRIQDLFSSTFGKIMGEGDNKS